MEIYDINKGETVYIGAYRDIPFMLKEATICSFDMIDKTTDHLTFNVEIDEDKTSQKWLVLSYWSLIFKYCVDKRRISKYENYFKKLLTNENL